MQYIKDYLKKLEELSPIPSGVNPELRKDLDIKACIFDIYGTLLISASGDIDRAEMSIQNIRSALHAGKIDIIESNANSEKEHLQLILDHFADSVKNFLEENTSGKINYPEINVLAIWEEVIGKAAKEGWLKVNPESDIRHMSFVFEILSNRVYPMPGMKEVVWELQKRGMVLGIVSNSQFYTPLIMNYFLGNDDLESEDIFPFDPDLTVYSFKMLKAKPDVVLFTQIIPMLKDKHGLDPNDALFVGNDMLNDVYPAREAGFKTALFAGDKRSLRWREELEKLRSITPDVVITELNQLLEMT
jgi:putative hydrolase of the HAD superfamily